MHFDQSTLTSLYFALTFEIQYYHKKEKKIHILQLKVTMVYGLCMEANRTARLSSWPPSCLASKKSATMQDSLALLVED